MARNSNETMARYSKELDEVDIQLESSEKAENGEDVPTKSRFEGAFVYFAAIAATLNITAMGLSSAYTSSTANSMKSPKTGLDDIGDDEVTWIASIVQMTAIPGAMLSGELSNKLGRKAVLIYNSVPYVMSWLMVAYSDSVSWIYAGRVITGCCAGVVTVIIPTYLTEISIPANRGRLGTINPVAFSVGLLCAMGLGMVMTWRWVALFGAGVVTLSTFLLCFAPESPSWLITHNRKTKAYSALKRLRGNDEKAAMECKTLAETLSQSQDSVKKQQRFQLSDFKNPIVYKPLLLGLGLVFFQQFNGVNALISYTEDIFEKAGGSLSPKDATLVVAVLNLPANLLSTVVMERASRRVFYTISGLLMSTGLILIGLFILLSNKDPTLGIKFGWMPLAGYVIFFVGFALGYAPLAPIMITEMTSQHARSIIFSIATVEIYIAAFIVTKTFDDLQRLLGDHGVYFMYAAVVFLGVIFGLLFLPETKGKTLEEIQKYFVKEDEIHCTSKEVITESFKYTYKF